MKSLFLSVIKGLLVTVLVSLILYSATFWFMSARHPKTMTEFRTMINDMSDVKGMMARMNSRSQTGIDEIHMDDDFDPAKQKQALEAQLNKMDKESSQVTASDSNSVAATTTIELDLRKNKSAAPTSAEYSHQINYLKAKLAMQQLQLDRIENQNRILTLQIHEYVKNTSKIKDH